jgi:hypothetical protein
MSAVTLSDPQFRVWPVKRPELRRTAGCAKFSRGASNILFDPVFS